MLEMNKIYPVLDDGFIRVVDTMGDDSAIVQAARVSYGSGTKTSSDDRSLIRYLMRHKHTSPFEMCEIKLHVRVPMDTWRQWIRHRTANVNEYSTRYSEAIDSFYVMNKWRKQSNVNKQGSSSEEFTFDESITLHESEHSFHNSARELYKKRLSFGVAREIARKDLPLSTYTEAYWKIDLHNLLHFSMLRMNEAAQYEIRQYANIIGNEIIANWVPYTWEAFSDYRLNAITFSKQELTLLSDLLKSNNISLFGPSDSYNMDPLHGREKTEFIDKLNKILEIGN